MRLCYFSLMAPSSLYECVLLMLDMQHCGNGVYDVQGRLIATDIMMARQQRISVKVVNTSSMNSHRRYRFQNHDKNENSNLCS